METVRYVAESGCKVKIGGVEYSGTKVIPVGGEKGMSESDIKDLLGRKFIRNINLDESGNETSSQGNKDKEAAKREKLLVKAKEAGIEVSGEMTTAEIEKLLKEAK